MLPLRDDYTFRFSDFTVIGLCDSSANCHVSKSKGWWFGIISPVTVPHEKVLPRNL